VNELSEIASSVNHFLNDIKAEVIIADLLENGLNPSDIIAINDGSFKRNFSRDVSSAEVLKLDNGQKLLGIHLTRDGLYDSLPEGIFHDPASEPVTSGHEMAKVSKKQKSEEKEARLFFIPFENEIFYHRVLLEMEERKILHRFHENLFDDIYPQFWNLDKSLPKNLVSRFVLILHFAHKIVGNPGLTARCLEMILDEEVRVEIIRRKKGTGEHYNLQSVVPTPVRQKTLGEDFICGGYDSNSEPVMEFTIGPLKNSTVEDFLENGSYFKFLTCFYSFFVPVEFDVSTSVQVSEKQQQFVIHDQSSNAILGFNIGI
jgi:hypothetical protein